ncbi:type IV pilus assembly protein PilM [Candidatus Microgenomates bacterium]|nr:type IV pilus assembly protein PilM [Candidatus Microgenomates bacterium]
MTVVGLDIGSKTIKVVELTKDGGKYTLKSAGVVGYSGLDIEHIQDDKEFAQIADAVKKLFKDVKISSHDVGIALPESQVFTRAISFPLLTDQEIASAIKWEAEQYIPIPINEAIVQHQVLERRENATPPEVLVLLVASARALVEKYVKVVQMAGLNCVSVETELMALSRSLSPANQTAIIVDFGARSTDIAIVNNSMLSFSRSVSTGGEALTRAVAQSLGVAPAQAEQYKKTYGLATNQLEGKVSQALDPVFRIITEEIKKAIHYYQTEEKGNAPASIVLSGGASGLPEAGNYLAKALGLEVIIGNPFSKVTVDANTGKSLVSFAPLYGICVGLALRPE